MINPACIFDLLLVYAEMFPFRQLRSLQTQIILSVLLAVVAAALVAGVPTIWLIRRQLDQQAWAQVENGLKAARSLYNSRQRHMSDLARLTARRPTLNALLAQGDWHELEPYLASLQAGEGVDLIAICGADGRLVHSTQEPPAGEFCAARPGGYFFLVTPEVPPQVWLMASFPLAAEFFRGSVVVGDWLDEAFVREVRQQTGLEHAIVVDGIIAVASYAELPQNLVIQPPDAAALSTPVATVCCTYQVADQPYYAARLSLERRGLELEVALPVAAISVVQNRMLWISAGSLMLVVLLGSLLGALLARRLSQPLEELAGAAERLSQGDLTSPVAVQTQLIEVAQVSHALESARADLARTLSDLQGEKAWVEHLLESIVEGIMTLDKSCNIAYFSHGAERITGFSRAEVLGRPCNQVFQVAGEGAVFGDLLPAPGQKNNIVVRLAGGREVTLSVTRAQLSPSGAGEGEVAIVFRDVSQEETVHRLLGYFIANVAHEFRTPLSALAASVELLMDQAPDLTRAEARELLWSLHLGALSLQNLVDNLLESASIEAGHFRVTPRPYDLREILNEAVATMRPLLEKYNQRLRLLVPDDLPEVQVDPRRVVQVLVNLLSNASKYGPADDEIELSAAVKDGWVQVSVADRGPGIADQHHDLVFRRFEYPNAGGASSKVGAGLGLSVVKAIVEAHGGRAEVSNRPGGGSIFWFTLPVARDI